MLGVHSNEKQKQLRDAHDSIWIDTNCSTNWIEFCRIHVNNSLERHSSAIFSFKKIENPKENDIL